MVYCWEYGQPDAVGEYLIAQAFKFLTPLPVYGEGAGEGFRQQRQPVRVELTSPHLRARRARFPPPVERGEVGRRPGGG